VKTSPVIYAAGTYSKYQKLKFCEDQKTHF